MPETSRIAKLVFPPEYGERNLAEAQQRGYLSHVVVSVDNGVLYPVFFYTPSRLEFELNVSSQHGEPFIAETGMIVVRDLTLEAMQDAVQRLCMEGFFDHLVPVTSEQIAKADPLHWPP